MATTSPSDASLEHPVPLSAPTVGDEELAAVAEVLESGWMAGQGPRGTELEAGFVALTGVDHAVAVNNCTAGLHLVIGALGAGPGDDVLVADYSFPATGHAVAFCGARPVFVDVRSDTGTIDVSLVEAAITPATVGIVAVDALGIPADLVELEELCARRGLFLVEDAACSAGGELAGRPCGSFGNAAVFSLHARKGITSGEGGVVVTRDAELAATVRRRACFGMASAHERQAQVDLPIPTFDELGYNYKLSDVLAAIAVVQLGRLPELLAARRRLADRYATGLAGVPGVATPVVPADRLPTWQTYALTVDSGDRRGAMAAELRRRGIGCNIGTYAMSLQKVYGAPGGCPVSASLAERHLAIPMYSHLSDADADRVIARVAEVLSGSL